MDFRFSVPLDGKQEEGQRRKKEGEVPALCRKVQNLMPAIQQLFEQPAGARDMLRKRDR
jgi:hypothetical protein